MYELTGWTTSGLHLVLPSPTVREHITSRYLPLVEAALEEAGADGVSLVLHVTPPAPEHETLFDIVVEDATSSEGLALGDDQPSSNGAERRQAASSSPHATLSRRRGSTRATASRPSSRGSPTSSRSPRPSAWRRPRPAPTTRCSSTARPASARPTCSTPSATTSTRTTANYADPVRVDRDTSSTSTSTPSAEHHRSLQAPLPRRRCPAHRRHPVHGGQGRAPGGVLPHVQLPPRRQQADRHLLRPHARRHPDARGPPAGPVQVGPHHRHPAARPGDPAGHPAQQGRARPQPAVPAEVLEFIATRVTNNIRELEGALIRVSAYASLNQVPPSPSTLAERLLVELLKDIGERTVSTPSACIEITWPTTSASARRAPAGQEPPAARWSLARQIGMYVMRELTDLSLPGHRPGVRRTRPHHRHPRRREDREADGRAPAGLRPGDVPHQALQDQRVSDVGAWGRTCGTTLGELGTGAWSSTGPIVGCPSPLGTVETA